MKKMITLAALVFASVAGFAQMKPQAGDCSIGINATPFLNYVGGFFSNAGATAPQFLGTAQNPLSFTMKHMRTDDMALVTTFGLGWTSSSTDELNGDETSSSEFDFDLFLGAEKRRGEGRIVGLLRGGLMIARDGAGRMETSGNNASVTEGGNTFGVGVGAGLGIEFFIAPMISLEGRYDANIGFTTTGERETDGTATAPATSSFGFVTAPSGSLVMHFWFR